MASNDDLVNMLSSLVEREQRGDHNMEYDLAGLGRGKSKENWLPCDGFRGAGPSWRLRVCFSWVCDACFFARSVGGPGWEGFRFGKRKNSSGFRERIVSLLSRVGTPIYERSEWRTSRDKWRGGERE
jgi:hypothetical protein